MDLFVRKLVIISRYNYNRSLQCRIEIIERNLLTGEQSRSSMYKIGTVEQTKKYVEERWPDANIELV